MTATKLPKRVAEKEQVNFFRERGGRGRECNKKNKINKLKSETFNDKKNL